jgi:hypothetical protein
MLLLILVRIIDMRKLCILFLFVSTGTFAQQLDSLEADTIKVPPKHLIGGYVIFGLNQSPGPGGNSLIGNVGIGFRYDKYEAGFMFSYYDGEYKRRLIFPNFFNLIYSSGGVYVNYALFESKYINVLPNVSMQLGDMVWEFSETRVDFLREKFSLLQLGVKIESPYLRYVRPEVIAGYQIMSDIALPELDRDKFKGFFIGFNVKVGYFNQ